MCGICLLYHTDGASAQNQDIDRMVKALYHRGPDDQNSLLRGNVALGHTRLSIVDIKGGAQPMLSQDGRYAITFNGEIYNYQLLKNKLEKDKVEFSGHSDTEVILQMFIKYKEACVNYLVGMFSFAIHDKQTGQLFVARDRLGIKPLFYHWNDKTLSCASEMKSLFATGKIEVAFDPHSIQNYFIYQSSVPPHTPFKSVYELLPGYTLTISPGGKPKLQQYWDLEFPEAGDYEELEEFAWCERFAEGLHEATQSHLIGEVPIGAYLSGGIDSATTSFLLSEYYSDQVQTFTMKFKNPQSDESQISSSIAAHLNLANKEVVLDDDRPGGFMDVLEQALYHVEQPQRMALDVPLHLLSKMVKESNYKVVYTGDGADEILGGYDCYRQDSIRVWGNEINEEEARKHYYLNDYKENFSDDFMRMLMHLHEPERQAKIIEKFGCYPAWHDYWHILDDKMPGLFTESFDSELKNNTQMDVLAEKMKPHVEGLDPLNQSLYIETKTRLPSWILWKTDRMTMAHGVEARLPFMDHKLVELAARIPPWLKLNGMEEKYILRKLLMPNLPAHPYNFKKRAFYTPIREWFFSSNHQALSDVYLSEAALSEAGIFNPQRVKELLDKLLSAGEANDYNAGYRIMKLEWVLLSVLSIQILHRLFIKRTAPCFVS